MGSEKPCLNQSHYNHREHRERRVWTSVSSVVIPLPSSLLSVIWEDKTEANLAVPAGRSNEVPVRGTDVLPVADPAPAEKNAVRPRGRAQKSIKL